MVELYLIRNGETEENLSAKIQGICNGKLTPKGIEQAKLVGKEFIKATITKVYCSPLGRAKDTFTHSTINLKPIFLSWLKERDFGRMTNKGYMEVINLPPSHRPEGGESLEDLGERAKMFLDFVVKENIQDSCVVAFSHHEFILSCVAYVIGLPLRNFRKMTISNASITQMDYYNGKWIAKRINDVGHLGDLKQITVGY